MNSVLEIAQRLAAADCKQPHPDSEIVSERMLNLSALFDFIGNIAAAGCFKSLAEEVAELEKRVAGSAAYRAALTRAAEICAAKVLDRMNAFDNGCWSCAEAIRGELQTDLPDMTESGWTPEQALRFYAEGRHFDVVNARTRILDTGAVASDALKGLSEGYAASKGCGDPSDSTTATALRLLRKRIPSHGTYAEEMIDALRILELALMPKPPSAGGRRDFEGYCSAEVEATMKEIDRIYGDGKMTDKSRDWGQMRDIAQMVVNYRASVAQSATGPSFKPEEHSVILAALRRWADSDEWWNQNALYGTRFYVGDLNTAYIQRDLLRSMLASVGGGGNGDRR
jgi:hypothetical protein